MSVKYLKPHQGQAGGNTRARTLGDCPRRRNTTATDRFLRLLLERNLAAVLRAAAFAFCGSGSGASAGSGVHASRSDARPFSQDSAQYRREVHLGFTGLSEIIVTHRGFAAEAVAYDLNIACGTLRGYSCREFWLRAMTPLAV